jgi:hypothetical protein
VQESFQRVGWQVRRREEDLGREHEVNTQD